MKKGKKILAMLSVLAMLTVSMVSSLALPFVGSADEADYLPHKGTFMDYSNGQPTSNPGSYSPYTPAMTEAVYNDTEKALSLKFANSTEGSLGLYGYYGSGNRPGVAAYPVVAAYVKNTHPEVTNYGFQIITQAGNANAWTAQESQTYAAGNDWQLIYWDMGASGITGYSWQLRMLVSQHMSTTNNTDGVLIKWFGYFPSVDAATAYVAGGPPPEEVYVPSDSFARSTDTEFVGATLPRADYYNDYNTRAFDEEQGAMKVTPLQASAGDYGALEMAFEGNQACSDYYTMAALVKFKTAAAAEGAVPVIHGGTSTGDWGGNVQLSLQGNTEWQLLVATFPSDSAMFPAEATWKQMKIDMFGPGTDLTGLTADDCTYWVKWAGVFSSVTAAYVYAEMTPPPSEGDIVAPNTPAVLVDISTETPTGGDAHANERFTEISYDANEQAYMVTSKEDTPFKGAQLAVEFEDQTKKTDYYRTIAAWVKVKNAAVPCGNAILGTLNDKETASDWAVNTSASSYQLVDGYQLVVWDANGIESNALKPEDPNVQVTWKGVILELLANGTPTGPQDQFWVKWVGIFASEDDAYGYAGVEKPKDDTNTSGVTPATMLDFSKGMAGGAQAATDNTKVEYDMAERALKVSPIDGNRVGACSVQLKYSPKVPVGDTDNKVYAALVKVGDPDAIPGRFLGGTENDQASGTFTVGGTWNYNGTTDWQLIVCDERNSTSSGYKSEEGKTANLFVIQLQLLDQSMAPENELPVWVKWHGIFSSVEDAYKYAGLEMPPPSTDVPPSPFFYNYSQKMVPGSARLDGDKYNTSYKYDKQEKALKVFPTDYSMPSPCRVVFNCNEKVSVEDYPVYAAYVKIPDKTLKLSGCIAGTDSNGKYSSMFLSYLPTKGYAQTTEYQLLLFDGTNYAEVNDAFTGMWKGALFDFLVAGTKLEEGQGIHIKWAGAFSSVQAVYDYTGDVYVDEYVDPNKNGPSAFMWELDNWDVIKAHVGEGDDTDAAYDDREGCMSVTAIDVDGDGALATGAGTITLGLETRIREEINVKDYPYFAMRIKLGRPGIVGSWAKYRTSYTVSEYQDDNMSSADVDFSILEYTPASSWQTIVIDCASGFASYTFDGTWIALNLSLFDSLYTMEEDIVYIKWAGAFKSVDEIKSYMKKTEGTDVFEPVMENIDADDDEGNEGSLEEEKPNDDESGDEYVDEYYDDEYLEETEEEDDDTTSDSDSSTKKTSRKKVTRTKKVNKSQEEASFPLVYVGIGIAVLAIAGLVIFLIVRKKRITEEKPE